MQKSTALLLLCALPVCADPLNMYDPILCFILDGILGIYGVFITAMFLREKFFRPKAKSEDVYSSLQGQGAGYDRLQFDSERGARARGHDDALYTGLNRRGEDSEYRELPRREQRQRRSEQVYQGLSTATRDTYDTLQQR